MESRREFIKKSILLSGTAGLSMVLPASIQRALAIDPAPGSTYLDAEHVVILMQENRSFDHCFGSLQGVRGFNDPRAFRLANDNPVWLQTNKAGKTYAPFRLDIMNTNATWMGSLPHSRASQVDAYNNGKYDEWLNIKQSGHKKYAHMPLTLGYYNRDDLPFNYAMADAFTVCDQNFCSAMTSTWPNRLYFWTGTVREELNAKARAHMRNDLKNGEAKWKTFPERLEENGISWKVYQNDVTCGGGFEGEERSWLSNFGCNPMEWFNQYHVQFSPRFVESLKKQEMQLPKEISALEAKLKAMSAADKAYGKTQAALKKKQEVLEQVKTDLLTWSSERYEKLSEREKSLHGKAFSRNDGDPAYHEITRLNYRDGEVERQVTVPKGDVLHRFREEVNAGDLPTVSWLVGPQNFSDHPSAPWYGAWYVSEILDILTKNPEVWKKTIFIVTYDENDGYFDHVPPFVSPDITKTNAGKCSEGIDVELEYIPLEQELEQGLSKKSARGAQIGLGYRVPMIIASPWSRGGRVNSQVFDHTSTLQFLEGFLNKKFELKISEDNISAWRRAVCGDLSSTFTAYRPQGKEKDYVLNRNAFVERIYNAQFKQEPAAFRELSTLEVERLREDPFAMGIMPVQEKGVRPSCAIPYQLYADGNLSADKGHFDIVLHAGKEVFGDRSAGSPFTVYAPGDFRMEAKEDSFEKMRNWQYAVVAGDRLKDSWPMDAFAEGHYHLRVYGPNGFYREYKGAAEEPGITVLCGYETLGKDRKELTGNLVLTLQNNDADGDYQLEIVDNAYAKKKVQRVDLERKKGNAAMKQVVVDLGKSFGWYDISIRIPGHDVIEKRYAGHVETGKESYTDPLMGRALGT